MDAFPTPSSFHICWAQMHCYQVLSPVSQHLARAHLVHVPKCTAIGCYYRLANIKCEVELVSCWQLVAYYVLLTLTFGVAVQGFPAREARTRHGVDLLTYFFLPFTTNK